MLTSESKDKYSKQTQLVREREDTENVVFFLTQVSHVLCICFYIGISLTLFLRKHWTERRKMTYYLVDSILSMCSPSVFICGQFVDDEPTTSIRALDKRRGHLLGPLPLVWEPLRVISETFQSRATSTLQPQQFRN